MKKTLTLAALGLLALPLSALAAEEWVSLFDGETLDGWIQKNGTAVYFVHDGAILGITSEGSPNSFLCSEKEYGNFELEFDVKLNNNELNSGVQIRSQTKDPEGDAEFGRVNGPQVEIEASGEAGAQSGLLYGEAAGGWMSKDAEARQYKAFKDGEWNHYRVRRRRRRASRRGSTARPSRTSPTRRSWRATRRASSACRSTVSGRGAAPTP